MITLISFIIVLGIIVFVHEFGHFLAAKLTGMRVEIFSLGFGKKLISKTIGDTEYRIAWIPLGGFVKISGMVDESLDPEGGIRGEAYEFESKNALQKAFVISSGVIFNFVLAIIIYTMLFWQSGAGEVSSTIIGTVSKDFPAAKAGLVKGDKIIALDGKFTPDWQSLSVFIHDKPDTEIKVTVKRHEMVFTSVIKTSKTKTLIDDQIREVGVIGVTPEIIVREINILQALGYGLKSTWSWTKISVLSIKMLISGEASVKDLGGPVLIAKMSGESARAGFSAFMNFIAFISINIGFLNILPIPVLDGGHLVYILIEAIIRRRININVKLKIQQFGMMFLFALMAIALFNDFGRMFDSDKVSPKTKIEKAG